MVFFGLFFSFRSASGFFLAFLSLVSFFMLSASLFFPFVVYQCWNSFSFSFVNPVGFGHSRN